MSFCTTSTLWWASVRRVRSLKSILGRSALHLTLSSISVIVATCIAYAALRSLPGSLSALGVQISSILPPSIWSLSLLYLSSTYS